MSARAFNWACAQKPKTTSQKLVLLVLADRADEDGFCWPGTDWIARKCAPMPRETARRVLRELAEQGLLVKERRKRRKDGTLGTWEMRLQVVDGMWIDDQWAPMHAGATGHGRTLDHRSPVTEPPVTSARADSSTESRSKENPYGFSTVVDHWIELAPPLIAHKREALLVDKSTRKLVDAALKQHLLDDVVQAVSNYAAVLGSAEHWLTQKWSMHLFFKQRNAFPMFLPEADPMTNYLNRGTTKAKRGLSVEQILTGGAANDASTQPRAGLPSAV